MSSSRWRAANASTRENADASASISPPRGGSSTVPPSRWNARSPARRRSPRAPARSRTTAYSRSRARSSSSVSPSSIGNGSSDGSRLRAFRSTRRDTRARELGAAARVVEVAREHGIPAREPGPYPWRDAREEHARDAVPEERPRRLRSVVEESRGDELVVRAEGAEDARGLVRVPLVRAGGAEVAHRLLEAVTQVGAQIRPPSRKTVRAFAGVNTIAARTRKAKKKMNMRMSGPYPSNVRHV